MDLFNQLKVGKCFKNFRSLIIVLYFSSGGWREVDADFVHQGRLAMPGDIFSCYNCGTQAWGSGGATLTYWAETRDAHKHSKYTGRTAT